MEMDTAELVAVPEGYRLRITSGPHIGEYLTNGGFFRLDEREAMCLLPSVSRLEAQNCAAGYGFEVTNLDILHLARR